MHLIWKRPDGFHGASPMDYEVIEIAGQAKIWLHKEDHVNFPFRISGGWQDEDASERLNGLVNLLKEQDSAWLSHLKQDYHNSSNDRADLYLRDLKAWLQKLLGCLKGDHWEQQIMTEVLQSVDERLTEISPDFIKLCAS